MIQKHRIIDKKAGLTLISITLISLAIWRNILMPIPQIMPITPIRQSYISTSELGGRLRIWGYDESSSGYEVLWSAVSVYYDAIAMGDVDNDGKNEVLGTKTRKATDGSYYEIFFDVYNEADSGRWERIKSIGQMEGVKEDQKYRDHEIVVADVDGEPGNEVIMKTHHWLVVYQYSEVEGDYKKLSSTKLFIDEKMVMLDSVTVGDVDRDGVTEILVSANEEGIENKAYLLIFQDFTLKEFVQVNISAHLGTYSANSGLSLPLSLHNSLHIGDLDGDGYLEICSTGYKKESDTLYKLLQRGAVVTCVGDLYKVYLFVWSHIGELILESQIYETFYWPLPSLVFDIGEIDPNNEGEEIAYSDLEPYSHQLSLCYFEESSLSEIWRTALDGFAYTNLYIADSDGDGDNEIVISGMELRSEAPTGTFYLEIFDEQGKSLWKRVNGEIGELDVTYMAVG